MDGIAIRFASYAEGRTDFLIRGQVAAGAPPPALPHPAVCMEVATGAVLPEGADTVIPYEDVEITGERAIVYTANIRFQQNVHQQGVDHRVSDILLSPGQRIGAAEMAILATTGKTRVLVSPAPRTAIIATGDELVNIDSAPLPWQIRQSNPMALQTLLAPWHIKSEIFHCKDDVKSIECLVGKLLSEYDLLLFSGGVSAGKKDYVPEILAVSGAQIHFHKVAQRPGKPLLFAQHKAGAAVFALPGNPVSAFLCACRYVIPWIGQRSGLSATPAEWAFLAAPQSFKPDLTWFLPVSLENDRGVLRAHAFAGHGSGDLANLHRTNGFLELPQGQHTFGVSEPFRLIRHR
ncbi:MAG: molybdopterin molybdotransferase MoeA [Saprospirales bacterium]|nr:molybdopterin molybdotransferase MoeA [Saprospirales bacterium]